MADPTVVIHDSTGGSAGGRPRLLLVSYVFPPSQAVGGLRWLKFATHFAEAGWSLDVLTLHPSSLTLADPARLQELPAGTRVFGVHQPKLAVERVEQALLAMKQTVRRPKPGSNGPGNPPSAVRAESLSRSEILSGQPPARMLQSYHAWLDFARVAAWGRAAEPLGETLLRQGGHRAIVSCGPPHMAHEVARRLAGRASLPFIVDFRDPLSLVERLPIHFASPTWYKHADALEERLVADSALFVVNTEPALEAMRSRYPTHVDKFVCVMNGADKDEMPAPPASSRFLIAYAGSVYLDRDPRPFFSGAAKTIRELGLKPEQFGIEFIGRVQTFGGASLEKLADHEGIGPYVRIWPTRPRKEALTFLAGAAMLLSLPQDSAMAIPSKVFEYMQFDAWLLALAEPESATERLLRGSGADTVRPADTDGIAAVIKQRYLAFANGVRPTALLRDDRLTRGYQARRLLARIAQLTGQPEPGAAT